MNFDFEKMLSTLKETLSSKTVVGEPLEFGDVKLIPVMSVYYGFGAGSGSDARGDKGGSGAGGGGGARIHVSGMIVIKGDDVKFLATSKDGTVEKVMESISGIVDKVLSGEGKKDGGNDAPSDD